MLGFVDAAAMRVVWRYLRQGLTGDRRYLVLGMAALLVHLALKPEKPRLATEELRLGETLIVRHVPPPPTRRQRRKAARAEARAQARSEE